MITTYHYNQTRLYSRQESSELPKLHLDHLDIHQATSLIFLKNSGNNVGGGEQAAPGSGRVDKYNRETGWRMWGIVGGMGGGERVVAGIRRCRNATVGARYRGSVRQVIVVHSLTGRRISRNNCVY